MNSVHFESFSVKGDKITLHKSIIHKAIKYVKEIERSDPYGSEDREAGQLDILEELIDCIDRWNYHEQCKPPTRGEIRRMREAALKAKEKAKYILQSADKTAKKQ